MRLAYRWLFAATAIFVLEIAIALGLGGSTVRGSVGDVLVIMLIHCTLRGTTRLQPGVACLLAITCGFVVEGLQWLHAADKLGLAPGSIGYIVLGNTATSGDLAMYLTGGVLAFVSDALVSRPAGAHRPAGAD